jgi:hypothetical protein
MMRYILGILLTLMIIDIVPFVLYAGATLVWDLKPPNDAAPCQFLIGIISEALYFPLAAVVTGRLIGAASD